MIFDGRSEASPTPENGLLRKNELVDPAIGAIEFNGEGRKRMKLRRNGSLVPNESSVDLVISTDFDVDLKKNRSEIATDPKAIENGMLRSNLGFVCSSYGSMSVIGRRSEMEDALAVELGFLTKGEVSYDFFGVYDGHGGQLVAQDCREMLHKLLAKIVVDENGEGVIDWVKVMVAGFQKMDDEVKKRGEEVATVGSTAVVAVGGNEEVVVANCGDSRAVICRGGVAVQLSEDHKPDRPDELERIELSGGKVINWNGHRVLGVLATSRSIGDQYLEPFVIAEPEVKVIKRTKDDEFLILASDGLWDVVSNDLACQVARRCLSRKLRKRVEGIVESFDETTTARNRASEAAALLAESAIARGSGDNVSVIVVELNRAKSGKMGNS